MSWIDSRRANTLTPCSLARHPVLCVQAVSSLSVYLIHQNSHVFLAFLSSPFLWGLLVLLLPHLLLLLPLLCLVLFLEIWSLLHCGWDPLPPSSRHWLGPQPAASGSIWAQMNNFFFQCSSLGFSLGEALPCITLRDRDTVFVAKSTAKQLTNTWEAIVLTKGSTAGSFLLISSLEEFRESGKC